MKIIRALNIAILTIILASCSGQKESPSGSNEIEIGPYILEFPKGFKLIKEKGVDSHVGKISNGKVVFYFDYGFYSDKLDESIDDYISDERWKWNALAANGLLPSGDVTGLDKNVKLLSQETVDSVYWTLYYLHEQDTISYDIVPPEKYRTTKTETATIDNAVYKWVNANDYIGLYAFDMFAVNKSLKSHLALSITSKNVSLKERQAGMKILRSCTLKR